MATARGSEACGRHSASTPRSGVDLRARDGRAAECTRPGSRGRTQRRLGLVAFALLAASPARPELLAWDGTLSLDFSGSDPLLRHWELEGSHVALAEGPAPALGALHLVGGISDAATHLVSDPDVVGNAVAALQLSASLGLGTLSPFPPLPFGELLASRELPVFGVLRLCLLSADCLDDVPVLSFFQGPARAFGVGGTLAGSLPQGPRISVQAAPWTLGTATLPVATADGGSQTAFAFGFVHGAGSASGSTGAGGGEIQLVTPLRAESALGPGLSGLSRLRLRFVPEPGRLALLAAGSAFLLVLARHRTRA